MAIPVSTEWKNAIKAQFRYPAYMKVTMSVTPPGLREGEQVTATNTESIASVAAIADNDFNNIEPVATFEPDRWVGSGEMYLPSENPAKNKPIGWWNNNGNFTQETLTFIFDKPYTIPGVYAIWDSESNSWPTDLLVIGYSANNTIITAYSVKSINSSDGFFDAPFTDVKKVIIQINAWSKPGWRCRVAELMFGIYIKLDNNKLSSATMQASSSLLASELPKLDLKFSVHNYDRSFDPSLKDGYAKYFTERQKVDVTFGFDVGKGNVQWLSPWPVYLSAWSIPADSQIVDIATTSRLSFLTNTFRDGVYTGATRTFKEMALKVLNNSGIIKNSDSETPWELDPILDTLKTKAPEPEMAVNAILQLIANATGCVMSINPVNNAVRFKYDKPTVSDYSITKMQQLGDPAFKIADRLKSIKVGLRTYKAKSASEQVYSFSEKVAGTKVLEVSFGSKGFVTNPSATITGATIQSQVYRAKGAVITIVAPAAGAQVDLTITGIVVEESVTYIETYNDASIDSGVMITVNNPLITEIETLNVVAEVTKNYYLRRKTLTAPYIGYPELEIGDLISYDTNYGAFDADTTALTMQFNGGFTGTISGRVREVDK